LNGTSRGDWEGEFTYVGARVRTVIDYVVVNETAYNKMLDFKIEDRVDSDHMPLCLRLKKKEEEATKEEGHEEDGSMRKKYIEKILWNEEAVKKFFKERTEKLEPPGEEEVWSIEENWQWLKRAAQEAMVRKRVKIRRRNVGFKDWWDITCTRRKRGVHRVYKLWRMGKTSVKYYIEEKKKFRKFLLEKQKERREKEEMKLRRLKKEVEVWRFINKKRGKKRLIGNNIKKAEWKEHFRNLLGGEEMIGKAGKKTRRKE